MSLLAEEIVEEWLNRQGFFTIRGAKAGVREVDILAMKIEGKNLDLRHYEVQVSTNPIGYISRVPRRVQEQEGRGATSARIRSTEELTQGVKEWIEKKYQHQEKVNLRNRLAKGSWSFYLVANKVKSEEELEIISKQNISVIRLQKILDDMQEMRERETSIITGATGKDLVELLLYFRNPPKSED